MDVPYNPFNVHTANSDSKKLPFIPKSVSPLVPATKVTTHVFDFDELEKMDLEEFDNCIENVRMKERVRGEDEKKLRKLRRRIQNRWSSKMCRDKKRNVMNELKEELIIFKKKCEELEEENKKLKQIVGDSLKESNEIEEQNQHSN